MTKALMRWSVYFRRGHGTWLALLVSLANFVIIQYRLLIEYVPTLEALFTQLWTFVAIFILIYIPLSTIIGWFDYKKATVMTEQQVNPYFYKPILKEKVVWEYQLKIFEVLEILAKEKNLDTKKIEEARKEVEKWLKSY